MRWVLEALLGGVMLSRDSESKNKWQSAWNNGLPWRKSLVTFIGRDRAIDRRHRILCLHSCATHCSVGYPATKARLHRQSSKSIEFYQGLSRFIKGCQSLHFSGKKAPAPAKGFHALRPMHRWRLVREFPLRPLPNY